MRTASIVLLIIGILVALIGLAVLLGSFGPRNGFYLIDLPAQANHYERITVHVLTGGTVSVDWQSIYPVSIYVMTEAQHTQLLQTGQASGINQASGTSGSFVTNLPSGGTYYVEVVHGSGYESTAETGTINVSVAGIEPTFFSAGIAALASGVVLAILGAYYHGVAKRRAATEPPPYTPWPTQPWGYYGPPLPGSGTAPMTQYPAQTSPPTTPPPPPVPPSGGPAPGADLGEPPVSSPPVQRRFCVNCGAALSPGLRFCGSCGTAVA
jgi:hypothetical protein